MNIKKHITALEQSREMKALGFHQTAIYAHVKHPNGKELVLTVEYPDGYINLLSSGYLVYSAYLSSELGEWLPNGVTSEKCKGWGYYCNADIDRLGWKGRTGSLYEREGTEIQARAKMLIYLAKNKIIDPKKL